MMDHSNGLEKQIRTLRKRSLFTLFLTWLALFFTVVGIAAGYKNFLRVHDKAKLATTDAKSAMALVPQMASKKSIENWQREIRSQLVITQTQTTEELSELKLLKNSNTYTEDTLKQQIEQLTRQQQLLKLNSPQTATQPESYWQITEIRYLLKIATRHLNINQDVSTAISALKAADQELMALGNPKLLAVRGLIASDIAKLQKYQSVDLTSIITAIDDLNTQLVPKVVLDSDEEVNAEADVSKVDLLAVDTNSMLNRIKAKLDKTVVIKRYDYKLAKTIKGDTQQVRYELIRLKLETLKLLALKSQYGIYQGQLQQLGQLLKREHLDLLGKDALKALAKLESIQIQEALPILLASDLFDELIAGGVTKVEQ